jgi:hypothetical protein
MHDQVQDVPRRGGLWKQDGGDMQRVQRGELSVLRAETNGSRHCRRILQSPLSEHDARANFILQQDSNETSGGGAASKEYQ